MRVCSLLCEFLNWLIFSFVLFVSMYPLGPFMKLLDSFKVTQFLLVKSLEDYKIIKSFCFCHNIIILGLYDYVY